MLIVLESAPCPTPLKTMLGEEAVAEVTLRDFILERLAAIDIRTRGRRLDEQGAILPSFYTGIVEWIDVDSHAQRMIRQFLAALNRTIAIARGVIGLHRAFVVIVILRDRTDALDGIFRLVELSKDFTQVVRDFLVTDDDALLGLTLEVDMLHFQRADLGSRYVALSAYLTRHPWAEHKHQQPTAKIQ